VSDVGGLTGKSTDSSCNKDFKPWVKVYKNPLLAFKDLLEKERQKKQNQGHMWF